jgi:hypothetical protein
MVSFAPWGAWVLFYQYAWGHLLARLSKAKLALQKLLCVVNMSSWGLFCWCSNNMLSHWTTYAMAWLNVEGFGKVSNKSFTIVVTYAQFDSNIRVLYVFLGFLKNTWKYLIQRPIFKPLYHYNFFKKILENTSFWAPSKNTRISYVTTMSFTTQTKIDLWMLPHPMKYYKPTFWTLMHISQLNMIHDKNIVFWC